MLPIHPIRCPFATVVSPKNSGRNPTKRPKVKKPNANPGIFGKRHTIRYSVIGIVILNNSSAARPNGMVTEKKYAIAASSSEATDVRRMP